jgi:2-keto-4-pentenoate hydratase
VSALSLVDRCAELLRTAQADRAAIEPLTVQFPAGSVVLTGSLHASFPLRHSDRIEADFGSFGQVAIDVD